MTEQKLNQDWTLDYDGKKMPAVVPGDITLDLWHNNIVRILLVVVGTNLGVSLATLVILPSQVFIPLFMKIFGG